MKDLTKEAIELIREKYFVNGDGKIRQAHPLREIDIALLMSSFAQSPEVWKHLLDSKHEGEKTAEEYIKIKFHSYPKGRYNLTRVQFEKHLTDYSNQQNAEKDKEIAQLKAENGRLNILFISTELKNTKLEAENEKLKHYAQHQTGCYSPESSGKPCVCGLQTLLNQ